MEARGVAAGRQMRVFFGSLPEWDPPQKRAGDRVRKEECHRAIEQTANVERCQ
jgi:hypothetical protein